MKNICIVGDIEDLTCVYIAWLAERRGVKVLKLSENVFGVGWGFDFDDLQMSQGKMWIGKKSF